MLRAFNGECEALLADIRWDNAIKMKERLNKSYEAINKLGETHQISITNEYFKLKTKELLLTHEYREKKQQEKEEQRKIQEQIREEEKAQKERNKAIKDAEDEEKKYSKALEQAKKELENAQGNMILELRQKIKTLQEDLNLSQQNKAKALSMAQQTKAGHVYVISNIGSFGDNIFKIGMTRRLEPMDRVKELGDASVPFSFDVHAMIYTDNAPELESILHKQFENKRVNMVNNRREFFQTTLSEIENIVKTHNKNIEFIYTPEAKEYRESIEARKTILQTT